MNQTLEANLKMMPWSDASFPPAATHKNGDSDPVFVLLEGGEIIVAWYEHSGNEWVSSTKPYPLQATVIKWHPAVK